MSVEKFLKQLNDKGDDGVARLVYSGRALSKSHENLHMCVSSGVVLIPLEEIEAVSHVYEEIDDNLVQVTVKNADRVRHALKLDQLQDTPAAASPTADGPMDLTHWDHGTATDGMILDACDATDVFVPPAAFKAG